MNLTVKDRIVIADLLPEQGGMIDMILAKSIVDKTSLTARDVDCFNVKQTENSVTWDQAKDTGVEISFEQSEIELLKKQVKEFDEKKQITMRIFDLCKKISEI